MQQILDKTRKHWQAIDPGFGYQSQFQYSKNIDVTHIRNGLTLSSITESKAIDIDNTYCVFNVVKLVRFIGFAWWSFVITYADNTERPSTSHVIWTTTYKIEKAEAFKNLVYGFWAWYAVTVVPNVSGAVTDITSAITWTDPDTSITYNFTKCTALMNYSNSLLLVADWNLLRRYVPTASPWLPIGWKVIRNFEVNTNIVWLTMEWSYLKIRVQDSYGQTKVHYATGTFDVEYTGLVQTIKLDKQTIVWVESDMEYDYVLCLNAYGATIPQYNLYRMQWTNKTLIKRTYLPWQYRTDFLYPAGNNMQIKSSILYCPMWDGVRTFRNEVMGNKLSSRYISAPCLQRSHAQTWYYPKSSVIFGNYLYTCYQVGLINPTYVEERVNIEFRPDQYQPSWYLISQVQEWGLESMDKENFQLNLWYLLPRPTIVNWSPTTDPWHINIYLRYDRSSLDLNTGRVLIKRIDNYTMVRERVFLTTEELFRRDRNVLEYKIEIVRSVTNPEIAPIFYEYNHLYNVTNRLDVIWEYKPYTP